MRLRIENLHKGFDGEKIIDGLSYSLEGNFFLTILGSSGSGKTTLLRIISGILKPERGTVDVHSERLGFVFQDDRLIPWLTAHRGEGDDGPVDGAGDGGEAARRAFDEVHAGAEDHHQG
ncbi:MAG: ATP-binding cassette domain-containing protein, partial [Mesotoga sp.]